MELAKGIFRTDAHFLFDKKMYRSYKERLLLAATGLPEAGLLRGHNPARASSQSNQFNERSGVT
jgi:hypothetical protein